MLLAYLGVLVMLPGGVAMVYLAEALGHHPHHSPLPLISFFGGAALIVISSFI